VSTSPSFGIESVLGNSGLGQREAARELGLNEPAMRGYCPGDKVPRHGILALERLMQIKKDGKRIV
jgi:hypothetical protein